MEEQNQLYQFYYYPEHELNFNSSVSEPVTKFKYSREDYTEIPDSSQYVTIDVNQVRPISLTCLPPCGSRRSLVESGNDETTPLLNNGNATLANKFFAHRKGLLLTVFILFYGGFLILGSITFSTFELSEELNERQKYLDVRQAFSMKYPTILGRIYASLSIKIFLFVCSKGQTEKIVFFSKTTKRFPIFVTDADLEEFIENVVKISEKGVSVLRNATGDLNWSFGQALIFSATVITTIGK